ncbi:MAG: 3-oxoacyl-[acyl-carrier-protein] synthase III C-terminal domain-containing protein [bacterium]
MIGISAYGAYVPITRLALSLAAGRAAKDGEPERAVAAHDEDTLTMAVAAATDCLGARDREGIDALYLATTTSPYREKSGAALVAKALDLRRDVATAELGGCLRAGLSALAAARDAVASGAARHALVIASDSRLAAPRSALERDMGDGAAAFVVSATDVLATIDGRHAVSDEIVDVWRAEHDEFVRSWEDRFVTQHGYHRNVVDALRGLLATSGVGASDLARLALAGPDGRSAAAAAKAVGIAAERVVPLLFGKLGHTGAAFAPMLLVHALESPSVAAGERIACVAHGSGAEAMLLTVTPARARPEPRPRRGLTGHLGRRRALASYQTYLTARQLSPTEHDARGGGGVPATVAYRERDAEIALRGLRCTSCGTLHFPRQRVCHRCHARDRFEPVRLSDRPGRVLSYTFDWFFPSAEPPTIAGVIEIDGARLYVQMTDAAPDELRCDLPVEMVFRRIHEAGGRPNYFWKSTPIREGMGRESMEGKAAGGDP